MGRAPDRAVTRKHSITTRMDDNELRDLDAGGSARGGMDRSTYLRWLVAQDKRRIAQEKSALRGVIVGMDVPAEVIPITARRGGLTFPAVPAILDGDL